MPRLSNAALVRPALAVVALGAFLAGCSDIYYDRRETVALGADDAVATNRVAQMVDPWPRYSVNRNYDVNGEKMQGAVERYRTGQIIQPKGTGTSSAAYSGQNSTQSGGTTINIGGAPSATK